MIYTNDEILTYFYIKYEDIFLKFIEDLKNDFEGSEIFNKHDGDTNVDFVQLLTETVDIKSDFLKNIKK